MQPQIALDVVYYPNEQADEDFSTGTPEPPATALPAEGLDGLVGDDSARFRRAAAWIAQRQRLGSLTVSISLVNDSTIRELNREQLGHDWATDVISFVFETEMRAGLPHVDGEVIASYETAARLAEAAGWSVEDELLLYVVHGMLHLAGLDDVDESLRLAMRQAEQACLAFLEVAGANDYLNRWERVSY